MTEDTEAVDPQAQAADNEINDFRSAHNEALLDTSHPEHGRRSSELKAMYEVRYAEQPNQFDPVVGQERPDNAIDKVAEEEMQPLSAEEFSIGPDSDFGMQVDTGTFSWDSELESNARKSFAAASLNDSQARLAATTYYETVQPQFNVETASEQSAQMLELEYGTGNVGKVVAGTNRMLKQIAGNELYQFIGRSGLGAHPRFVGEAVRIAKLRGYF